MHNSSRKEIQTISTHNPLSSSSSSLVAGEGEGGGGGAYCQRRDPKWFKLATSPHQTCQGPLDAPVVSCKLPLDHDEHST